MTTKPWNEIQTKMSPERRAKLLEEARAEATAIAEREAACCCDDVRETIREDVIRWRPAREAYDLLREPDWKVPARAGGYEMVVCIDYDRSGDEYRTVRFCPFCGAALPTETVEAGR